MGNTVKISFSAVTHVGSSCTVNNDRIFANGKFLRPSVADYAQISSDMVDTKFLFSLSGNMEDDESGISLMSDLKRFHQKAVSSSKDIHVKLDELVQCIEQSSNLIHSLSLGENDFGDKKPSFAGVLIDGGNIAAVNLGSYRIYKLEGDTFKLLVNDYKRAERLLKMGIISDEQAELLSSQQKASIEEGRTTVKKSDINPVKPGITYLICSSGLTDAVSEDQLYDILASNAEPDATAAELVAEAHKNEPENDVTAVVIAITDVGEKQIHTPAPSSRAIHLRSVSGNVRPRSSAHSAAKRDTRITKNIDIGKIVSLVVLVFLATAVVLGGYKLWTMIRPQAQESSTGQDVINPGGSDNQSPTSSIDDDDPVDPDTPEGTDPIDNGQGNNPTEPGTPPDSQSNGVGTEGTTYTVKSGDMLMVIAKRFYGDETKYKLIMDANKITDPNKIAVGQKLIIPPDK